MDSMQTFKTEIAYMDYELMARRTQNSVRVELLRQLELKCSGKFEHIAYDEECPDITRLAMLREEVGEVARAVQRAKHEKVTLKEELIQIAAIAVAWASRL